MAAAVATAAVALRAEVSRGQRRCVELMKTVSLDRGKPFFFPGTELGLVRVLSSRPEQSPSSLLSVEGFDEGLGGKPRERRRGRGTGASCGHYRCPHGGAFCSQVCAYFSFNPQPSHARFFYYRPPNVLARRGELSARRLAPGGRWD